MKILVLLIITVSCFEASYGFQVIELFQAAQAHQVTQLECINSMVQVSNGTCTG